MSKYLMAESLQGYGPAPEAYPDGDPGRAALAEPSNEQVVRPLDRVEALYREHADFVHRAVLRLGGPSVDADDLTHEVFLVALRKWDGLAAETDPRGWLYGVTARAVSAARRKTRWRRRLGLANPPPEPQAFDAEISQNDARSQVYRLVEGMSEKKRTVFLLFEVEGLSGEEIAALVHSPLKTIWTRLHYARREFLKALELERKREP